MPALIEFVRGGAGLITVLRAGDDQLVLRPGERVRSQAVDVPAVARRARLKGPRSSSDLRIACHMPDRGGLSGLSSGADNWCLGTNVGIRDEQIGASRPLAPWQVSTRTSSAAGRGRGSAPCCRRATSAGMPAWTADGSARRRAPGRETLDRLGCRRTEPGEQALATAALAEQAGVELEGRQIVDLRQQLVQAPVRLDERRRVARQLQTLVEAGATTVVGEFEQRFLGQAEQRAAQHGGEVRSSSGNSSTSPSAIRSMTAMSSVSASRSAPATGTCSR